MKKAIMVSLLIAAATAPALTARDKAVIADMPRPANVTFARQGELMQVTMDLPLDSMRPGSNTTVELVPVIINGADSVEMQSVAVYGRTRFIQHERGIVESPAADVEFAAKAAPATYSYTATVPWQEWMDGATLRLDRTDYGCCSNILGEGALDLAMFEMPRPFQPQYQYIRPIAEEVKERQITGRAYIDFPVNRTEIRPDYRRNIVELAKIRSTIDSVRNDRDITVRGITIHGYASPEGPYDNNVRLAKGRTEALTSYVQSLYSFNKSIFHTEWTAEDWAGLRDWVENHSIANRDGILAIIDMTNYEPDAHEWKLKSTYPEEYKFLLAEVYPGLRHSDYTVNFDIRQFTDINEIKRLAATEPQKLSLNEFFLAAQTCEPGSEEYNRLFDTAVRMYPDSEVANVNAANAAMSRGDYASAATFLAKAGDGPEAVYARGILAALRGDNAEALDLLRRAARLKVAPATDAIEQIERIMSRSGK